MSRDPNPVPEIDISTNWHTVSTSGDLLANDTLDFTYFVQSHPFGSWPPKALPRLNLEVHACDLKIFPTPHGCMLTSSKALHALALEIVMSSLEATTRWLVLFCFSQSNFSSVSAFLSSLMLIAVDPLVVVDIFCLELAPYLVTCLTSTSPLSNLFFISAYLSPLMLIAMDTLVAVDIFCLELAPSLATCLTSTSPLTLLCMSQAEHQQKQVE